MSGLDALAYDGLRTTVPLYAPPPLIVYMDRGVGGAIRRAFTRLPDGARNTVALVRLPRERLCGNGFASLMHEVGHQGNALLKLPSAFASVLHDAGCRGVLRPTIARWWASKLSEALADLWACAKLGATGTLGLFAVMGRSSRLTFQDDPNDPHPMPWIRAKLSIAFGARAMPHPIWRELDKLWTTLYPQHRAPADARLLLASIAPSIRVVADLLATTRVSSLHWRTLPEALGASNVSPSTLLPDLSILAMHDVKGYLGLSPCVALAAIGLSRYRGVLNPASEERTLRTLLEKWASIQAV